MEIKLDKKDRKILYELDKNSRQSFKQIGKKVGLSREVIQYRIKQLEKKGVIKGYQTLIDTSKLGYINCRFFIKFQKETPEEENKIIEYYKKNPKFWWVASIEGFRDLGLACWVKDIYEFYEIKEEILQKFGKYIDNLHISIYSKFYVYNRTYLIEKKQDTDSKQIMFFPEKAKFDKKDFEILKILSKDARTNSIEISKKTGISITNINHRIKQMMEKRIIIRFKVLLDLEKIGYYWYKIEMQLTDTAIKKEMLSYFHNHPNIVYAYETISENDIEFEIESNSPEEFRKILAEIRTKFSRYIKKYYHLLWFKEHKFSFMPEI